MSETVNEESVILTEYGKEQGLCQETVNEESVILTEYGKEQGLCQRQ